MTKHNNYKALADFFLNSIKNCNILVIGDAMLDRFIVGNSVKLSAEAPIPVLVKDKEISMAGGALNVVRNLRAFGVSVSYLGVFNDQHQSTKTLLEELQNLDVNLHTLNVPTWTIPIKTRYQTDTQQVLRLDVEDPSQILQKRYQIALLQLYKEILPTIDVVIFSDYAKGLLCAEMVQEMIHINNKEHPLIVDPKPMKGDISSWEKWKGVDLMTPNLSEYHTMLSNLDISNRTLQRIKNKKTVHFNTAKEFLKKMQIDQMIITLSENGASYVDQNSMEHETTDYLDVFDVSGAGDTYISIIATLWKSFIKYNYPKQHLLTLGNIAAGIAVSKQGTATVTKQEVMKHLSYKKSLVNKDSIELIYKIKTQSQSIELVKKWKEQGLVVGFTNGCFDILHIGHIQGLEQAKHYVDKLIVAVNSDTSVEHLKGIHRPVNSLDHRMQVLAALEATDVIVPFEDNTPIRIFSMIKPDVLFKGKDYLNKKVVGEREMEIWGGHVQLLDFVDGVSTSSIIKKIQSFT